MGLFHLFRKKKKLSARPAANLSDSFVHPQFGEFVYDFGLHWYIGKLCHQNASIMVYLDEKEHVETLTALSKNFTGFFKDALQYAAAELSALGNDWCYDSWINNGFEEADYIALTPEAFIARLTLSTMHLCEDGSYIISYDDGDVFWGHSILVSGTLSEGFTDASIAG